ncbi:hypothetical protein HZR23_09530 [Serpentinicella alkaliphila]|nr:hypothetical protein HZR23_09530 [Serpentinicella alkaliphila]
MEKACKRDSNFMWLIEGEKSPDHNKISSFRNGNLSKVI